jgi:hypothetical protein
MLCAEFRSIVIGADFKYLQGNYDTLLEHIVYWGLFPAKFYAMLNETETFDVCKSVHHHTIQIIQPTRCGSFTSLLLDVYVWLNMFRASHRPSLGAYNCTRSLWFYRWREAAGALLVVVG